MRAVKKNPLSSGTSTAVATLPVPVSSADSKPPCTGLLRSAKNVASPPITPPATATNRIGSSTKRTTVRAT